MLKGIDPPPPPPQKKQIYIFSRSFLILSLFEWLIDFGWFWNSRELGMFGMRVMWRSDAAFPLGDLWTLKEPIRKQQRLDWWQFCDIFCQVDGELNWFVCTNGWVKADERNVLIIQYLFSTCKHTHIWVMDYIIRVEEQTYQTPLRFMGNN